MNELQAGKYKAKVTNYGFKKTHAGEPAVVLEFNFSDSNAVSQTMSYQGSLRAEGREGTKKSPLDMTLEVLEICGFDFKSPSVKANWLAIAHGNHAGVLNADNEVQVTVEYEISNDGRSYPRIKWVNRIGGGLFTNMMSPEESVQVFNSTQIFGNIIAFASKSKGTTPSKAAASSIPMDEIPF